MQPGPLSGMQSPGAGQRDCRELVCVLGGEVSSLLDFGLT